MEDQRARDMPKGRVSLEKSHGPYYTRPQKHTQCHTADQFSHCSAQRKTSFSIG